MLGLCKDNGKENGHYYHDRGFIGIMQKWKLLLS